MPPIRSHEGFFQNSKFFPYNPQKLIKWPSFDSPYGKNSSDADSISNSNTDKLDIKFDRNKSNKINEPKNGLPSKKTQVMLNLENEDGTIKQVVEEAESNLTGNDDFFNRKAEKNLKRAQQKKLMEQRRLGLIENTPEPSPQK